MALLSQGQNRAAAQTVQIVSPSIYADAEAPGFIGNVAANLRFQQVFPASDFESLSSAPLEISQIAFRPDGDLEGPWNMTFNNLVIWLSTTSVSPPDLSFTFANNIGPDETKVFEGRFPAATANIGPPGGPKEFDYIVTLQQPFRYNPSAGNLLLDWTHQGASRSTRSDWMDVPGPETHLVSISDPNSPTAGTGELSDVTVVGSLGGGTGSGPVDLVYVPEPRGVVLLAIGVLCIFLRRRVSLCNGSERQSHTDERRGGPLPIRASGLGVKTEAHMDRRPGPIIAHPPRSSSRATMASAWAGPQVEAAGPASWSSSATGLLGHTRLIVRRARNWPWPQTTTVVGYPGM